MRWSLVLAASSALLAVSNALVIPAMDADELVQRAPAKTKLDASSKTYRENSKDNRWSYQKDSKAPGGIKRDPVPQSGRRTTQTQALKGKDADHILEKQLVHGHLKQNGKTFGQLPANVQKDVSKVVNGGRNVTPVDKGINRGKGQVVRLGQKGQVTKPQPARDQYIKMSYGTAKKTAEKVDRVYANNGVQGVNNPTVKSHLQQTMRNAGVIKPGQPSPPTSGSTSPKSGGSGSTSPSSRSRSGSP